MKYFFSLVFLACLLAACGEKKEEKEAASKTPIDSMAVTQIVALGRIEPEMKISSLAMNATGLLSKLPIQEGQKVLEGQVLLILENSKEQADLALKQAKIGTQEREIAVKSLELAKAKVDQEENQRLLRLSESLFKQGAETAEAYAEAKAKVNASVAEINRLEAAVVSAQVKVAELRADIQVSQTELAKEYC